MKKKWDNVIVYVVKLTFHKNNIHYKNNESRKIERFLVFDSNLSIEDIKQQIEVTTKGKFEIFSLSEITSGLYNS